MITCQNHPEKSAVARGLCSACYHQQRRAKSIYYAPRGPVGSNYAEALDRSEDWLDFFRAKVRVEACGCHVWTGAKIKGRGVLCRSGRTLLAHRLAAGLAGRDPAAQWVHSCGDVACVNPDHLVLEKIGAGS